jgi:hypothetical protein
MCTAWLPASQWYWRSTKRKMVCSLCMQSASCSDLHYTGTVIWITLCSLHFVTSSYGSWDYHMILPVSGGRSFPSALHIYCQHSNWICIKSWYNTSSLNSICPVTSSNASWCFHSIFDWELGVLMMRVLNVIGWSWMGLLIVQRKWEKAADMTHLMC